MIALLAACVLPGLVYSALGIAAWRLTRRYLANAYAPPAWARRVAYGGSVLLCLHGLWLSVAGLAYLLAVLP